MPERPSIYEQEHEDFRGTARAFMEKEVVPPTTSGRRTARSAARSGPAPASRGCSASTSTRSTAAPGSRTSATTRSSPRRSPGSARAASAFPLHTDIIVPYISNLANDEQKHRWLPGLVSGELISAIAMTEPGAGSDLQGIRTTRRRQGRPLRAQRRQDVHQQRHHRRPGHRGGADRSRRRPPGHQPARRRARHAGLRARPQPREDRPARPRTPPSCSSTTSRCRRPTCSARRAPASSH